MPTNRSQAQQHTRRPKNTKLHASPLGIGATAAVFSENQPEWQQEHLAGSIFGVFAWLALALAAVGALQCSVLHRRATDKRVWDSMALGAQRGHVLRIVFASTLQSVGSGVLAGVALALVLNKMLAKWAEGNSRDPIILLTTRIRAECQRLRC